jgi:hypothetical protein
MSASANLAGAVNLSSLSGATGLTSALSGASSLSGMGGIPGAGSFASVTDAVAGISSQGQAPGLSGLTLPGLTDFSGLTANARQAQPQKRIIVTTQENKPTKWKKHSWQNLFS